MFKILIRITYNSILLFAYFISGFFPRNKKIMVYGCPRDGFSGNAKYAYLYDTLESKDDISRYWITADRALVDKLNRIGMRAVNRRSARGVWIALRAGVYVYSSYVSDVNFWCSRNARLINYWHGLPLKHIEFDINRGPLMKRYNPHTMVDKIISFLFYMYHPAISKRPHMLCSPFPGFDRIFMRAFRVDRRAIFREEYPLWRYLRGEACADDILMNDEENKNIQNGGIRLLLYVPTFRDSGSYWVHQHLIEHLPEMDKILARTKDRLLIKLHPNECVQNNMEYENIQFLDSGMDIHPVLKEVDDVITDYSSVMMDCVVSGKNVVLYWPDFQDYMNHSRDSYFDLEKIFGEKPIRSPLELKNILISSTLADRSVNKEIRDNFMSAVVHEK